MFKTGESNVSVMLLQRTVAVLDIDLGADCFCTATSAYSTLCVCMQAGCAYLNLSRIMEDWWAKKLLFLRFTL